jgi:hypothetical protein
MKLYHGTRINCKDRILENGLEPNITESSSGTSDDERFLVSGIFGFANIDDAICFADDLCESSGIAIFSFEVNDGDVLVDPEYEGESYFMPTEESIAVTLEHENLYR